MAFKPKSDDGFIEYPEITDPDFYEKIYLKKEFNKTRYGPSPWHNEDFDEERYREDIERRVRNTCGEREFRLQNHQEFVKNYISPETPYKGVLLFHGMGFGKTCSAIGIAEGYRDYVHEMGKYIYILSSEAIEQNFYRELYNERKATRERLTHAPVGSFQCAGNKYATISDDVDEVTRIKKIHKGIRKYYKFMGPSKFANEFDIRFKIDHPEEDIGKYYANSVFIIDEAHGIAGVGKLTKSENTPSTKGSADTEETQETETLDQESDGQQLEESQGEEIAETKTKKKRAVTDRSPLQVFLDLIERTREYGGITLVLLTATPMKDTVMELLDILQLLNENDNNLNLDGEPLDRGRMFKLNEDGSLASIDEEYLKKASRGYISYIRGNNPISFPKSLDPPGRQIYEPAAKYDIVTGEQIDYRYILAPETPERDEVQYKYKLVMCPMSNYQFKVVRAVAEKEGGGYNEIAARQASNFSPPTENKVLHDNLLFADQTTFEGVNLKELAGAKIVETLFNTKKEELVDSVEKKPEGKKGGKPKKHTYFEFKRSIYDAYGDIFDYEGGVDSSLRTYSQKFWQILDNIYNTTGIQFAYSEFEKQGALLLALTLEANGFVHYVADTKWERRNPGGESWGRVQAKKTNYLFSYPEGTEARKYRCHCGVLEGDHDEEDHPFKQGTYVLYTGKIGRNPKVIEYVRDLKNKHGSIIKIIIGSRVIGEGVDLKMVRGAHIIDPWHNNTRINQAIARALRHCSHADLDVADRNVTVFKYCSCAPLLPLDEENIHVDVYNEESLTPTYRHGTPNEYGLTLNDYLTETPDERIYRRVIRKDIDVKRIERILKMNAIDCQLNKNMNYYGKLDIMKNQYSWECDYNDCNYTCNNIRSDIDSSPVDSSTYNLYFAQSQINKAKRAIIKLYIRNTALSFSQIVSYVNRYDPQIEPEYTYMALDQLVGKPPTYAPEEVRDKYDRKGYLIQRGDYFIFQIYDIKEDRLPISYRSRPIKLKRRTTQLPQRTLLDEKLSTRPVTQEEIDHLAGVLFTDIHYTTMMDYVKEEDVADPDYTRAILTSATALMESEFDEGVRIDLSIRVAKDVLLQLVVRAANDDLPLLDFYMPQRFLYKMYREGFIHIIQEHDGEYTALGDGDVSILLGVIDIESSYFTGGLDLEKLDSQYQIYFLDYTNPDHYLQRLSVEDTLWENVDDGQGPIIDAIEKTHSRYQRTHREEDNNIFFGFHKVSSGDKAIIIDDIFRSDELMARHQDSYRSYKLLENKTAEFKLYDGSTERLQTKKEGEISGRTKVRGFACSTKSASDTKRYVDKFRDILVGIEWGEQIAQILTTHVTPSTKIDNCKLAELMARAIDICYQHYGLDDSFGRIFLSRFESIFYYSIPHVEE
jgi:hypothetical protein